MNEKLDQYKQEPNFKELVEASASKLRRSDFVPSEFEQYSDLDRPLPIGFGQTISQPSLVRLMTRLVKPTREMKVLEVGTGSGYQAAVLAQLVAELYTIEVVEALSVSAQERLKKLGLQNIYYRVGNGRLGWPECAPFDAIVVTAACSNVPRSYIDQLGDNGRLVVPVGPIGGSQSLMLYRKNKGKLRVRSIVPVAFVPLVESNRR